jgi:hypothetical protein
MANLATINNNILADSGIDPISVVTGSGIAGQIAYWNGTNTQTGSNNLFWDTTNNRLGIGTNAPSVELHIEKTSSPIFRIARTGGTILNISSSITATGAQISTGSLSPINFGTNGIIGMTLSTSSNLLIGTTVDTGAGQKLQVTGTSLFTDSATFTKAYTNTSDLGVILSATIPGINLRTPSSGRISLISNYNSANSASIVTGTGTNNPTALQMFFDFTNLRVGIGTPTPNTRLDVLGAASVAGGTDGLRIGNVGDNSSYDNVKIYYTGFNAGAPRVYLTPRTTPGSGIVESFFHIQNSNGSSTTSNNTMGLLVDGSVGIGNIAPTQKLHVTGSIRVTGAYYDSNNSTGTVGQVLSSTATGTDWVSLSEITGVDGTGTANYIAKWLDANTITDSLLQEGTNSIGLGVTPSAWAVLRGFQVGLTASIGGYISATEGAFFSSNSFYNGGAFVYQVNGSATQYLQINGQHRWSTAISGTAGANIPFTQAMTLDANGYLGIGTTAPTVILEVSGASNLTSRARFLKTGTTKVLQFGADRDTSLAPYIGSESNHAFSIITNNIERARFEAAGNFSVNTSTLFVDAGTNRVGIGNTVPVAKLDITGSLGSIRALDSGAELYFTRDGNNDFYANGGNSAGISIGARSYVRFLTGTTLTETMRINTAGDVGIGTSAPEAIANTRTLTINGGTGGGAVSFQVGSVRTGLINGNDNYLTLQSYASRALSLGYNGTNTLVINTSNNVGIGTTAPLHPLDVTSAGNTILYIRAGSATSLSRLVFGTSTNTDRGFIDYDNTTAARYMSFKIAEVEAMRIINNRNVGIGTSAPSSLLHISGAAATLQITDTSKTAVGTLSIYALSQTSWSIATGTAGTLGTQRITITDDGYIGLGTTTPTSRLYVTLPGINTTFDSGTAADARLEFRRAGVRIGYLNWDSGVVTLQADSGNYMTFNAGGSERMRITATGDVGIGTSAPNVKLDVNGTLDLRNAFQGYARFAPSAGNGSQARLTIRLKPVDTAEVVMASLVQDGSIGLGGNITDIISMAGSFLSIASNGQTRLRNYGVGTFTGTVAYNLAVDANGNVIETAGGVVDGSGTANYVSKWQDANTLTNSLLFDNGTNVGIGGSPIDMFFVSSATGGTLAITSGYQAGSSATPIYPTLNFRGYANEVKGQIKSWDISQNLVNGVLIFSVMNTSGVLSESMRITADGRLGIGTTAPQTALDVSGAIRVSGTGGTGFFNGSNAIFETPIAWGNIGGSAFQIRNTTSLGLVFGASTSQLMTLTTGGNLGIGTTNPYAGKLHISGANGVNNSLAVEALTAAGASIRTVMTQNATDGTFAINLDAGSNAPSGDLIIQATGSEIFRIKENGNVGIGTSAPAYKLDVNGAIRIPNSNYIYINNAAGTAIQAIFMDSGDNLVINTSTGGDLYLRSGGNTVFRALSNGDVNIGGLSATASPLFKILNNGNVGVGTTAPAYKLHVVGSFGALTSGVTLEYNSGILYHGGSYYQFPSGSYYNIYGRSGMGLIFGSNNAEAARFDLSGNLGIGTTAPAYKLDVAGTARITGASLFNGNLEVNNNSAGVTVGDFFVDATNKTVYVGRISTTSGDNSLFIVRDRLNVARVTLGAGGSVDHVFRLNASNFDIINYGGTTTFLRVDNIGALRLGSYGTGARTGTVAYNLAVDALGNVIETAGGVVDGSGTANYVPLWQDANTLTNSAIYQDASSNVVIGGTSVAGSTFTVYGAALRSGGIGVRNSAGTYAGFFGTYAAGSGSGSTDIYIDSAGFTSFGNAGSERMRITSAGNVGIGTSSPLYSLDILAPTSVEPVASPVDNYVTRFRRTYTNNNASVGARRWNVYADTTYNGNQAFTNASGIFSYINYANTNSSSVINGIATYVEPSSTSAASVIRGSINQLGLGGTITNAIGYYSYLISLTAGATTNVKLFQADTTGTTNTITNLYGFIVEATLTNATNNYGFFGNIASGTGRWNTYMAGTASNYFRGNVGVNETAPTAQLHINGEMKIGGDTGAANARLTRINFVRSTYDPTGVGASIDFYRETSGSEGALAFSTNPGVSGDNAVERMRINAAGNVGIGTTTGDPFSRGYTRMLGISTATASGSTAIELNGGSGGYGQIDFGAGGVRTAGISGSANETQWGSLTAIPALIYTNSAERMRITATGDIGIGTSAPNQKLQVLGFVNAQGYVNNGVTFRKSFSLGNISAGATTALGLLTFGSPFTHHFRVTISSYYGTKTVEFIGYQGTMNKATYGFAGGGGEVVIEAVYTSTNITSVKIGITTAVIDYVYSATVECMSSFGSWVDYAAGEVITPSTIASTSTLFGLGGGNVGINNSNPLFTLDLNGTLNVVGASTFNSAVTISRGQNANVTNLNINSGTTPVSAFQINTDQPNSLAILTSRNSHALVLSTNDTERVRITTAGNVGIATTAPAYRLHVVGTLGVAGDTDAPFGATISNANLGTSARTRLTLDTQGGTWHIDNQRIGGVLSFTRVSTEYFSLNNVGALRLNAYGTGARTGTVAYNLAVDASGNIIETAGGVVDGAGTANYVSKWSDPNTLTDSVLYDSGTNIGIGTATPIAYFDNALAARALQIVGNGRTGINFQDSSAVNQYLNIGVNGANAFIEAVYSTTPTINYNAYSAHIFITGSTPSEKMRITSAGLVGINTTAPVGRLDVVGTLVTARFFQTGSLSLIGTDTTAAAQTVLTLSTGVDNATGPNIILSKSRTQSNGSIVGGDVLGTIQFQGGNGASSVESSRIQALSADVFSSTSRPSDLLFFTTAASSTTVTERMRIRANGNVGIGDTGPSSKLQVGGDVRISGTGIAIDGYSGGFLDFASGVFRIRAQEATGGAIAFMTAPNGLSNVSTERMRITSTGSVWVGAISAAYQNGLLTVGNLSADATLGIVSAGSTYLNQINFGDGGFGDKVQIVANSSAEFYIQTRASGTGSLTEKMRITSAGNVGIGTSAPTTSLVVRGNTSGYNKNIVVWERAVDGAVQGTLGFGKPVVAGDENNIFVGSITNHPLLLLTNNLERLRITDAGNVGIGTTTPTAALQVARDGGASTVRLLQLDNTNVTYSQNVYLEMNISKDILWGQGSAGGGTFWNAGTRGFGWSINGTRIVTYDLNGNVGINTTVPTYKLSVNTGISSSQTYGISIQHATTGINKDGAALGIAVNNSGQATNAADLLFATADAGALSERMRISSSGSLLIGTTQRLGLDTNTNRLQVIGGITIGNGLSTYVYATLQYSTNDFVITGNAHPANIGDNSIIFRTGSSGGGGPLEHMRIVSTGNVGIGTTTPAAKLSVQLSGSANQRLANFRNIGGNSYIEIQSSGAGAVALWAAADNQFGIYQNATAGTIGTAVFYVNASGNVGIGNTNPTAKLEVTGESKFDGRQRILNSNSLRFTKSSIDSIYFADIWFSSTDSLQISSITNSIKIGGGSPAGFTEYIGIASGGATTFISSVTATSFNGVTNNIFSVSGTEGMRLTSTGLGIGNTTPGSFSADARTLVLGNTTAILAGMTIANDPTGTGGIYFADGTAGTAPYAGYLSYYHTDNSLSIGTAGTQRMVIGTNGATSFYTGTAGTATERIKIKDTGQLRFVPLASDPAGAQAGDVYYNSTTNVLKYSNGTTWNDMAPSSSSYTPTLTLGTNAASGFVSTLNYFKNGSMVHIIGKVTITSSTNAPTTIYLSLPIASAFTDNADAVGFGDLSTIVAADVTNDRLEFYLDGSTTSTEYGFMLTYVIK